MTAILTVGIRHNVTRDARGRRAGPAGFTPGEEMVKVFACDVPANGRDPAAIAEDAYAAFNDAAQGTASAGLAQEHLDLGPSARAEGEVMLTTSSPAA
jgi:hypothetical protein